MLVVPASSAGRIWVLDASGRRRLVLADEAVFEDADGTLVVRASAAPTVHEYHADIGRFEPLEFEGEALGGVVPIRVGVPVPGEQPPAGYGDRAGRASAPTRAQIARHGTAWTLPLPAERRGRRFLEIEWAGDVAQLEADGEVVADRFWDGTTWTIGLDALGIADDARLVLRIVPLHPEAPVHLPAAAAERRRGVESPLLALDAVRLVEAPTWRELRRD